MGGRSRGRPDRSRSPNQDGLETVTRPHLGIAGELEDVPNIPTGQQHPPRRHPDGGTHDEIAVEQRGGDLEPHPEGVDRPRAFEQQGLVGSELAAAEEPAHPLAPGLGDDGSEPKTPRSLESDRPHGGG